MRVTNLSVGAASFTSNAFLLEGERCVLVDAGSDPVVLDALEGRVDRLDAVVVTHLHGDHVGNLEEVLGRFGGDLMCVGEHPSKSRELRDGDAVPAGDGELEVLHAPGHTDDSLVLVGEHAVFTGDAAVYADSAFAGGSFGRTDGPGGSRELLVEGLRRLSYRLPGSAEDLYPGHGPTYHGDPRSVIERAAGRAERGEPKYRDAT